MTVIAEAGIGSGVDLIQRLLSAALGARGHKMSPRSGDESEFEGERMGPVCS